ncbi:class A beta-lactamase-related serine hydrolase [Alteromonas sediminis]|uniref:Class A beta-lactamase-related serine hydrolase n=1 Tax=Alteromonas sediminis TaxID=2259342 RepID=A0A3N5YQU2_9ALTE|nr:serine hydrolase domain-containing protein [Alteromonas sediminis]RPJ68631.1 class A beta-lactamase-related serine hydrolase [Alteromonas sediminis]
MQKLILCLAILLPLSFNVAGAEFNKKGLDAFFNALDVNEKAMLGVTVRQDNTLLYQRNIGFSQVEKGIKADANTAYRVGSITKTFTAVMIMQLIEDNTLRLSDTLHNYYPQFPNANAITLEHLLLHRSGIFNITNAPEYTGYMTNAQTKAKMLERMAAFDADFAPGEKQSYSNAGYILLGYILEEVTGMPYAKLVQEKIIKPLKLERTFYGQKINTQNNEAHSYQHKSVWQVMPETDMSIPHGAGAIVSTSDDLSRFFSALFNGKLVSQDTLKKMMTLVEGLGMGLFRMPFGELWFYGHNGGIDGFVSSAAYQPESKISFAVTANGMNYTFNDILIAVLSAAYGMDVQVPDFSAKEVTLNEEQLRTFEGTYVSDALPMDINVFLQNGVLHAQATGQGAFPLAAYENNVFKFDAAGIVMKFESPGDSASGFTLEQGGGSFAFTRAAQ